MSNVNQNRYKFTLNNTTNTINNNASKPAPSKPSYAASTTTTTGAYNKTTAATSSSSSKPGSNAFNFAKPSPAVVVGVDDDDIDISDTELIMASQEVESQLKFTNNVHHATSNTINIFSQMASTNSNNNLMPAPTMTSFGAPTQNNHAHTAIYPSSSSMANNAAYLGKTTCFIACLAEASGKGFSQKECNISSAKSRSPIDVDYLPIKFLFIKLNRDNEHC